MLARMLARTPHPRRYPSTPVPSPFVFAHCHGRPSALRRFSMRMPPSPRVRNPPPPPPSPSSPPPLSQPQFPRFPHYPGRLPSNPVKLPDGTNYVRWFLALTLPFAAVSLFSGRTPLVSPPPLSSTAQQHARQRTPLLRLLAQGELRVAAELAWNRVVRGEAHARICHTLGHVPASGTSLEPGRPWHWWSYVTHQFIHGSLIHWGCSVFCLNAFFPMLAVAYGPGLAAAIGVACGAAASAADEALLYREAGLTSTTRRRDLDPIVEQKLVTPRVGASGSLMALFTISAIVAPHLKYELMFIPIGIPGRVLWGLFCAWDIHGAIQQSRQVDPSQGGGINHRGHLMGSLMGALTWALYLRRMRPVSFR